MIKKSIVRSPVFTLCSTALMLIMVVVIMALSTATQDLNRQKLTLDSVLNDVTASVYPMNNNLTDWEVGIESRENRPKLLLDSPSAPYWPQSREELNDPIRVVRSRAADEVKHSSIELMNIQFVQPIGDEEHDEIQSTDEALASKESLG